MWLNRPFNGDQNLKFFCAFEEKNTFLNSEFKKLLLLRQLEILELMKIIITVLFLCYAQFETTTAPDIEFVTQDGAITSLDHYKGQVIYLSFWASWCGPCKSNFKKYQSMREELEALGVVILNVSIDKNITKWHEALEMHDYITGVNVRALDIPQVMTDYNLSKVPDYHIIDKRGDYVYLSDKPNRDVISEFKIWLGE